jgi:hypothetical protein
MLRNVVIASALTVGVVAGTGCQEAKEKTRSTMSFVKGDAEAVVERTPEQVMQAARAIAGEMGLIVIATSTTKADTKDVQSLVARTTEDKRVTVRVVAESDKVTRLEVNTGLFGDSALRTQVLETIKAKLGIPSATATTQSVK